METPVFKLHQMGTAKLTYEVREGDRTVSRWENTHRAKAALRHLEAEHCSGRVPQSKCCHRVLCDWDRIHDFRSFDHEPVPIVLCSEHAAMASERLSRVAFRFVNAL